MLVEVCCKITDASLGDCEEHPAPERGLKITPDRNGATIEFHRSARSILLDYLKGELRIFITNENGEVVDEQIGSIRDAD